MSYPNIHHHHGHSHMEGHSPVRASELDLNTKVSTLVKDIQHCNNRAWLIDCKYYVFDINLIHLGNIVWTTFDSCTTLGLETWMSRYGHATIVFEVLFLPAIKEQICLKYPIMPCFPPVVHHHQGTILPGC